MTSRPRLSRRARLRALVARALAVGTLVATAVLTPVVPAHAAPAQQPPGSAFIGIVQNSIAEILGAVTQVI